MKGSNMEITDITGRVFTIDDIDGAIALVTEFLNYQPSDLLDSQQRLDEQRLTYWRDFLKKLQQSKN